MHRIDTPYQHTSHTPRQHPLNTLYQPTLTPTLYQPTLSHPPSIIPPSHPSPSTTYPLTPTLYHPTYYPSPSTTYPHTHPLSSHLLPLTLYHPHQARWEAYQSTFSTPPLPPSLPSLYPLSPPPPHPLPLTRRDWKPTISAKKSTEKYRPSRQPNLTQCIYWRTCRSGRLQESPGCSSWRW